MKDKPSHVTIGSGRIGLFIDGGGATTDGEMYVRAAWLKAQIDALPSDAGSGWVSPEAVIKLLEKGGV